MKESELRRLIKEEIRNVIKEGYGHLRPVLDLQDIALSKLSDLSDAFKRIGYGKEGNEVWKIHNQLENLLSKWWKEASKTG